LLKRPDQSGAAIYLLVIIVGSVILFSIESGVSPNVIGPDAVLWYTIVTITIVG